MQTKEGLSLKEHQKEALEFLATRPGAGLFFEMGLGKTLIMLKHMENLNGAAFPLLIVCPLSAVSVWPREAAKFGFKFKFQVLTGDYNERWKKLNTPADVYVINYEGLRVLPIPLREKGFKGIIFDESHRIKDKTSFQTTAAMALSENIPYRYIMTGTPVSRSPEDIWSQMMVVDRKALPNFWTFRNRYLSMKYQIIRTPKGPRKVSKASGFKNLERVPASQEGIFKPLKPILAEYTIRKTKAECLDLPAKIYKTVYCPLTPEQLKHYYSLKSSLATMVGEEQFKASSASALMQKMQQICQGFLYQDGEVILEMDSGKLQVLKDLLKDLEKEKVIVFTWYQADTERLYKELKAAGHTVVLYGGTSEERSVSELLFQSSEQPTIFLAQIEVAKESITLTAASHVIYYGNSWNYASRMQSEDRAHRMGQTRNVVYHDFVVAGTVDESILESIQNKGEMADAVNQDTARMAKMVLQKEYSYAE